MVTEKLNDDWHSLLFGIRRSIRYHQRRKDFYSRFNSLTSILVIVFGSATTATLLTRMPGNISLACALIMTIIATIELVIGTTKKSTTHNDLMRRFLLLEQNMTKLNLAKNEKKYNALYNERLNIEIDEPAPLRVLDAICHNELMRAMGYPEEKMAKIRWYQRLFSQYFDVQAYKIQ